MRNDLPHRPKKVDGTVHTSGAKALVELAVLVSILLSRNVRLCVRSALTIKNAVRGYSQYTVPYRDRAKGCVDK